MHWIDLQNSFGICELGFSWRNLNKRLHSGFALRLLQAPMRTLQPVPLTGPLADVKPHVWEIFNLGTRPNVIQTETLEKQVVKA